MPLESKNSQRKGNWRLDLIQSLHMHFAASDLGLHCLLRLVCPNNQDTWYVTIYTIIFQTLFSGTNKNKKYFNLLSAELFTQSAKH